MKKTITIYELLELIKGNKAPKNIKFENYKYTWKIGSSNYFCERLHQYLTHFIGDDLFLNLNLEVEIISNEEEFEYIEECFAGVELEYNKNSLEYKINQLIKNQKLLIEKIRDNK